MLIANAWKEVYERFDNIMMMDVVDHIKDIDPIVIERSCSNQGENRGKETVYVRLLGDICPQEGIVVYFSAEDFCIATQEECYIWCESDADLCMQTGIIGLFGKKEYVSRYNQNILQELGIQEEGKDDLLPYFNKLEYGYLPGKVTSAEAAELADILMQVERLLTEIGEIEEVPEGKVLLRQYDTEQKRWNNIITSHPIVAMMDEDHRRVAPSESLKAVEKLPGKGTWSVLIQPRGTECGTENGKKYYPMELNVNVVRGSGMKLLDEVLFSPAELKEGAMYGYLCTLMQKQGKPAILQYTDEVTMNYLRPFCKAVGIALENQAENINNFLTEVFQENRDAFMQMLEETNERDADSVQKLEQFMLDTLEKKAMAETSCVISVSLGTGLYRHIRIQEDATLDDLHHAILDAFGFSEDGHLYAFTLPGRRWFQESYMSPYDEDAGDEDAAEYTIAEVLPVGSKCTYTFDFGDNWEFTCKVLREIDEPTETPVVIRQKGENPVQYPAYDQEDE